MHWNSKVLLFNKKRITFFFSSKYVFDAILQFFFSFFDSERQFYSLLPFKNMCPSTKLKKTLSSSTYIKHAFKMYLSFICWERTMIKLAKYVVKNSVVRFLEIQLSTKPEENAWIVLHGGKADIQPNLITDHSVLQISNWKARLNQNERRIPFDFVLFSLSCLWVGWPKTEITKRERDIGYFQ